MRRTRPLPRYLRRRMPRNGRCSGTQNPARARSKCAKAVDEAIRRADADETRAGNSQNRRAAVVRSVSTEAAVRFHRYRKSPFFSYDSQTDDCFLQLLSDSHRFRRQIVNSAWGRNFRPAQKGVVTFHGRFLRSKNFWLKIGASLCKAARMSNRRNT